MPDSEGRLTDSDKIKVTQWLTEKWKQNALCPITNDFNWIIGDHTVTPVNFGDKGTVLGGKTYPQVMVICKTCGYTVFFNSVIVGLFPPKDKPDGK